MSTTKRSTRRGGLFASFEGGDGCGKTTQMRLLAERLRAGGYCVIETVEPGGTSIGDQVRRILLNSANQELSSVAELLLYFASRAQNLEELIWPGLARGAVVLTDRFTDSTMAYQGFGRGLGQEAVVKLDRLVCRGLKPDLTVLLDIDPQTGLERARGRWLSGLETRMDDQAFEFHNQVRKAYLAMAAREPRRFRVIDGHPDVQTVARAVWEAVQPALGKVHV